VAIIAPHGGKIEPWTSAIATAIAADDYCLYCFEGRKRRENRDLHITSTHFDEPQCLTLVSGCDQVVAVHGARATSKSFMWAVSTSICANQSGITRMWWGSEQAFTTIRICKVFTAIISAIGGGGGGASSLRFLAA
jgi:hypothetical protein